MGSVVHPNPLPLYPEPFITEKNSKIAEYLVSSGLFIYILFVDVALGTPPTPSNIYAQTKTFIPGIGSLVMFMVVIVVVMVVVVIVFRLRARFGTYIARYELLELRGNWNFLGNESHPNSSDTAHLGPDSSTDHILDLFDILNSPGARNGQLQVDKIILSRFETRDIPQLDIVPLGDI